METGTTGRKEDDPHLALCARALTGVCNCPDFPTAMKMLDEVQELLASIKLRPDRSLPHQIRMVGRKNRAAVSNGMKRFWDSLTPEERKVQIEFMQSQRREKKLARMAAANG